VVGCREYGSEHSGVTKFREILDQHLLIARRLHVLAWSVAEYCQQSQATESQRATQHRTPVIGETDFSRHCHSVSWKRASF